jgi:hypothetical protein
MEEFPILVDVYEAAVKDCEAADGHRHGYFCAPPYPYVFKNCSPCDFPRHSVDKKKNEADDLRGWYGKWPGIGE